MTAQLPTQRAASHRLYWLEQAETDLPAETGWLNANESTRLAGFRFPKRRADWLLGRWTAKNAVAIRLGLPLDAGSLANVEIRQASSGAPQALVADWPAPVTISLSHSTGRSICAVGAPDEALGCDLELVEPRSESFFTDYFVPEEQALVARVSEADRPRVMTLIWSAKESALKALGTGLRLDTRRVVVSLAYLHPQLTQEWSPLSVRHNAGQVFQGWWLHNGRLVRTVVTSSLSAAPILLTASTTGYA